MTTTLVREQLAALFLDSCKAATAKLTDAGVSLAFTQPRTHVVRSGENHDWETQRRWAEGNILRLRGKMIEPAAPLLGNELVHNADECAAGLLALEGNTLLLNPTFFPPGGWPLTRLVQGDEAAVRDEEPVRWVREVVLLPALLEHMQALPQVDQAEPQHAKWFSNEVVRVATTETASYRVSVPLSGIDIQTLDGAPLQWENVTIRYLSDLEQGDHFDEVGTRPSSLMALFNAPPLVVLECIEKYPRNEQMPLTLPRRVRSMMAALQLYGFELAGHSAKIESVPKWLSFGAGLPHLGLPGAPPNWRVLTPEAFVGVAATARCLERWNIDQPKSTHDLALHRFCSGVARTNDTDAVLDFTIALESLLLPYDANARHSELSYRFRLHGAYYLTDEPSQRQEMSKTLNALYTMRSRLVHGGKYPTAEEIRATRQSARELAQRGLMQAVHGGFPTANSFTRMALGLDGDADE
ncbi:MULTISPECIES: hypothetical protein [Streptomyces]|uniref:hypothetical protein n=1 Tax=Streptomyces TaxID=1883 RepID=UPI0036A9F953